MNTTGINELEATYEAAIRILTGLPGGKAFKKEFLEEVFATSFLAYGVAETEKYQQVVEIRQLLQRNGLPSPRLEEFIPIFRSFSPDLQAAAYVDELHGSTGKEALAKPTLRITVILYKLEEGWRVTHLHVSEAKTSVAEMEMSDWEKEKAVLEEQVEHYTSELKEARETISDNQVQLVRQEKLASLGQLTAGIAHEIKNPLNFITNFSELSSDFLLEIKENVEKLAPDEITEEILALLEDVKGNLKKIHLHGTRVDSIVKSMLLHSRGGNERMEPTDLNALIREYVNLAFHGMRANKNPINVDIKLETEEGLMPVKINAENFSRVILNLCKNAFDAMREKQEQQDTSYHPRLSVRTRSQDGKVIVEVEDNGPGIPDAIKGKILLPFFTTKMGSDGTGLGLSISQEIIKKHGGELRISTKPGEGTKFLIELNSK